MKPLTDEEFQVIKELYDAHPHIHIPTLIATVESLQSKLEGVKLAFDELSKSYDFVNSELAVVQKENSELKQKVEELEKKK